MIAKDSFKQELTDLIADYSKHIQKYISGDKTDYIFCPVEDEENGISDKNYLNRTQLCFALFYETYKTENKENIVRELFIEEVKARENESYQIIGINLEILTSLLLSYKRETDKPLFERAKNANFDCSCGYEFLKPRPLSEFPLEDCIGVLDNLGEKEMMFRFADEFKSNISNLTELKIFDSIARYDTRRTCDREFAAKELYSAFKKSPEEFKGSEFSAVSDYIEILIEKGEANEALAIFIENENIISEYESGYFYFELGTKIIACGAENPKIIWNKILSILEGAMKIRMAAHSYHKELLAAAELSGDTRFFKKLQKFLDSYGIIENKQITEKTE